MKLDQIFRQIDLALRRFFQSKTLWQVLRWLILAVILGFPVVAIAVVFREDHFARYWIALMLPILAVLVLGFWYLIFGWAPFRTRAKRFGFFVLGVVVLAVLVKVLFRYEGSTSGTSIPKLAFRWTPKPMDSAPDTSELESIASRAAPSEAPGAVDSAQFYGPGRDAMWPEDEVVASFDWKTNPPEELWRRPIGLGWSGFAVAGGRAITQEQRGDEELVTCYDLLTGDLLWAHRDEARFYNSADRQMMEMAGDGPRAVPTIHGGRVYTYGATGVFNCLELETGKPIWSRNVLEENIGFLPEWGKSTSPLVVPDHNLVVVSANENMGPTLVACRLETGEPVWQYQGNGSSYSSPRLIELHGVTQIVSVNGHDVTGNDPATGEELWSFGWKGSMPKVGQPIELSGDRILVTAGYGVGSYLLQIGRQGDSWSAESIWKSTRLKTKFSSAVVRGGFAYALDEGRLACVDLKDGKRKWKDAKYGYGQQLLLGDKLLVQAEDGYVAVAKASPEGFEEIGRIENALSSMTWNPPTIAGRYLLVRNDKEAVCFRLPAK